MIEQLQSVEQVSLLDAIDKLRYQGIGQYDIGLPQLIVCGDQSSGKSSVLEGLTRLRFPTKDGLCTTFATELVLRKAPEEQPDVKISCKINPAKTRNPTQARNLDRYQRSFSSREEFSFPSLIDEVKVRMSFGTTPGGDPEFYEDVLHISYTGPDVPSLTIVDLPGLIQFQINGTGAETVSSLVRRYMEDQKSIILAVVSASNDSANQIILKYVQELDPKSSRTMGIITKPDTMDPGSERESDYLALARNQKIPLHLGWHVVKNRSFTTRESSAVERDEMEKRFFGAGVWTTFPRSDVGIDSLRIKLSRCLLRHIRAELPSLSGKIQESIISTACSLENLGKSRESTGEQRTYLILKAQVFQRRTCDALRGSYGDAFFASPLADEHYAARLRTKIHNLNIAFATTMYQKGRKWDITGHRASYKTSFGSLSSDFVRQYVENSRTPTPISRTDFLVNHIGNQVKRSRQAGLPSLVNSWVVTEVFREQCEPWKAIGVGHLFMVFDAVREYVQLALNSLMDSRMVMLLNKAHIERAMEQKIEAAQLKFTELLVPYQELDMMTYDPTFTTELEEIRTRRYLNDNSVVPGKTPESIASMDDFTNREILDLMQAYYERAISVFISNVTVLAIEACLVKELEDIFAPSHISSMSDDEIHNIASECDETREERAELARKLADLTESKNILDLQAHSTRTSKRSDIARSTSASNIRKAKFHSTRPSEPSSRNSESPRSRSRTPISSPENSDRFDREGMRTTPSITTGKK
ncbi:hypothetical protein K504DRAFT_383111 [Pleomassaria siparia CBS 279.74]|uniref:Dynamin family protein n=1 Tax=Pleomassaria siparia CBS 279.74 TaxID=1314801 RepID=A0A6G1K3T8_9PLEO|nr:hypothetical protein K504DRAFT_383111 [Pleomassaria siparia CBS 279.74]